MLGSMLGKAAGAIGGAMKGAMGGGAPKPRGPMLHDTAPMTGPAQLSKPPKMGGARRIAGALGNRKMTGGR